MHTQRLEGERRAACEEQLELERQLSAALSLARQAGGLKEAVAQVSVYLGVCLFV